MPRRDDLYLADIAEAAESIRLFLSRLEQSEEGFVRDALVRSAVLQKLSVIGEAAARISDETRRAFPLVPWNQARGMRNLLVHAYFSVDWDLVWTTATESVPLLAQQVSQIIESCQREST